jgi:hypothetical protein
LLLWLKKDTAKSNDSPQHEDPQLVSNALRAN